MSRNLMSLKHFGVLVLLTAALTIAGCSDNSVIGPDQSDSIGLNRVALFGMDYPVSGLPDASAQIVETEMTVDALLGATIPIKRNIYHHAFVVAPGGLEKSEIIEVKSQKESVNGQDVITFEFGPDGLVFAKASKLKFDMAELNPNARTAKLYYFDPRIGDWVLQAQGRVNIGKVVIFEIYHFSKYAISD